MSTQDSDVGMSPIELFDDDGLGDTVAKITGREPEAADELSFYILLILDELGSEASEKATRAVWRSVELDLAIHRDVQGRARPLRSG